MAKQKTQKTNTFSPKTKGKGKASKKWSKRKESKNYKKPMVGQGKG